MAKLVGYAMLSTEKNAIDEGHLVKAMCEFCGAKFGSIKEAQRCESQHINDLIRKDLSEQFTRDFKSPNV